MKLIWYSSSWNNQSLHNVQIERDTVEFNGFTVGF